MCSVQSSLSAFPNQALTNILLALLEERIKHIELEELQQQAEDDCNADLECQCLTIKVWEPQHLQEEANEA